MFKKRKNKEIENIKRYKVKYNRGLTTYQANKRESEGYLNVNNVETSRTYQEIIIKNLFSFFNILLVIIGVILIAFGLWSSCVFLLILLMNIIIGLAQDIRSKRIVDKLSLLNEEEITVIREGKERKIPSSKLVLDDVYIIKKGMQIPCDSKILYGDCLINEALVTGESIPLKKDEGDIVLSGTYATNGRAYAQVEQVGDKNYVTQLQKKSKLKKTPKSKMYVTLNKLFKVISFFVILLGLFEIVLISTVTYSDITQGTSIYEWLKEDVVRQVSGALISMIPSGMYLLTSVSLAAGVIALFNQKIVVQDMYSIETIARVDTLCIDKTGTITDGTMSVFNYEIIDKNINENLFKALIGSYNGAIKEDNYTAKALIEKFGEQILFDVDETIPFNSVFKYGAVSFKQYGTIVVGAYGFVPLKNNALKKKIDDYSKLSYRSLVVAISDNKIVNGVLPNDLKPLGIVVLQDRIRNNAKEIISWFQDNDVNVKVVSGDNELTVSEIAKAVNIKNGEKYICLAGKSDEEVEKAALEYNVFGRVSPEQKEIIVNALKKEKRTVAMFGDGMNDLLGLKSANVSISINSAVKAAKDISSFVLMDNDFAKLTNAVAQGRRVINDLERTCSLFLTKTLFSIILNIFFLILGSIMFCFYNETVLWPFYPNTFYAWEIAAIGLSSFFLALEPNKERIKGSFTKNILKKSFPTGAILSAVIMGYYLFSKFTNFSNNPDIDRTISTYVISLASIVILFEVCFPFNLYRGIVFIGSILIVTLMFIFSIYTIPALNILELYPNDAPRYLDLKYNIAIIILILISITLLLLNFFIKKYMEKHRKGNKYESNRNTNSN